MLIGWRVRDKIFPPKETAVLFVSHPDDDVLFFHTFIKEHKPYVVLLTTGWSLRRMPCFIKAMRRYGVRFRAYDLQSRDTRTELLQSKIHEMMKTGNFDLCATHNASGEYGHEMHRRVHDAVASVVDCTLLTPVDKDHIRNYPLANEDYKEKVNIFQTIYTTELFVLEQYSEWVENEKLVEEVQQ
jgi:LmbE family N-acetylglucosaminyl deacetylase